MAKPTINLPPATIHHHKPTKPMFFTNRHIAINHQSKPSKANTSQLQTHQHPNPPQNLATHNHDPPKEGRHGSDLPSSTATIHPMAWRNPSATWRWPISSKTVIHPAARQWSISSVTTTHQRQDGDDLLRETREKEREKEREGKEWIEGEWEERGI